MGRREQQEEVELLLLDTESSDSCEDVRRSMVGRELVGEMCVVVSGAAAGADELDGAAECCDEARDRD